MVLRRGGMISPKVGKVGKVGSERGGMISPKVGKAGKVGS